MFAVSSFYEEFFCSWTSAVLFLSFFLHNFDTHKTPSTVHVLYDILEYVVSWVDNWLCRTVYSVQLFYRVCWDTVLAQWFVVIRCTFHVVQVLWCPVHGVRCVLQYIYGVVVYSMVATVWFMIGVVAIVYKSSCTVYGCTGYTNCVWYLLCSAVFCVLWYGGIV